MASSRVLVMLVLIASVVAPTLGENYMVDWKLGDDYSVWAQGKDFRVGDSLMFMYYPGAHNVVEVNGTELANCSASSAAVPLTTGNDVINLTAPGETGFICTIGNHCASGMKLLINVSSAAADAPLPGSTSSSGPSKSYVSMFSVLAAAAYFLI